MPDLNRYHPAVEAASKAWGDSAPTTTAMWAGMSEHRRDLVRGRMAEAFKGALPYLTADDLRGTPAGQALMAEAWEEGALHQMRGSAETRRVLASALPNPYRKDNA